MADELIIPFESFKTRGVQNNSVDSIQNSFFSNVYAQAFRLVEQIDKANESYNKDRNQLNDIQNVIAFTGRRGTGKTSSMLSFMTTLASNDLDEKNRLKDKFNIVNKGFCNIPYTDASLMTKNEDIFEIVLSKMLSTINNEYDEKKRTRCVICDSSEAMFRKVKEKICQIYNNYASLKNTDKSSETVPYNYMEKLADKYNVRNQFKELIGEYLSTINTLNDKKSVSYLIICIDDIDMSQEKHMDIMQCIHQYLMIPKVIVLVSFNIPMLTATIQKSFHTNVSTTDANDIEHSHQMTITRKQTHDFLRKIIPADMRIAMPSWKKKDYREMYPIYVEIPTPKKDENNDKCSVQDKIDTLFPEMKKFLFYNKPDKPKKLSPKQLIMLMLAERTSVYLDICGFKLHFMQPESLRELSDFFYLTYNMKSFSGDDKSKDDICKIRRENRKILLDYLHFKMLPERNFPPEIDQLIRRILEAPMERRGRIIWKYYYQLLSNKENRKRIKKIYGKKFYNDEIERNKISSYSLGSLYRILYSATRLNVIEREVVIFLLASLSFSMPQFVESEKKKQHDSENNEIYNCKRLREAFRYSLLGTWCKDILGEKKYALHINKGTIASDKGEIKNVIYAFMLCSDSTSKELKYEENNAEYIIHMNIDPTSFIVNTYAFNHRMNNTKLINNNNSISLKKFIQSKLANNIKEDENEELIEFVHKELINDVSFPSFLLKQTDLSYNVIKRVISEMIYASDNDVSNIKKIEKDDPKEIIKEFYERLYYKLKAQDNKYLLDDKDTFCYKFITNPVVNLFLEVEKVEHIKENGEKIIENHTKNGCIFGKPFITFEQVENDKEDDLHNDCTNNRVDDFYLNFSCKGTYEKENDEKDIIINLEINK